jgi:hypothetical protein
MIDEDGYPTSELLIEFRRADYNNINETIELLLNYWHWGESQMDLPEDWQDLEEFELGLHTGGWSGNEDIVGAFKYSFFWYIYWQEEKRGGHFKFNIRRAKCERFEQKSGEMLDKIKQYESLILRYRTEKNGYMTLRQAAAFLDMKPSELSRLENYTFIRESLYLKQENED